MCTWHSEWWSCNFDFSDISEATTWIFSLLCSRGTEHEDVVGDESWDRVWSDLLHEGQDWHELQQWLHERPHPLPLQEHSPPSHRKHLQVLHFYMSWEDLTKLLGGMKTVFTLTSQVFRSNIGQCFTNFSSPYSLLQNLPNIRLCLSYRGQFGGCDPRSEDHRVPRSRRSVLLDNKCPAPQEALHMGVRPTQPQQHSAVQEEAHVVRWAGICRWMVGLM